MNLNSSYENDINSDFLTACGLADRDFSHDEMISMLKDGNLQQKQIAALKMDSVNNPEEGKILVDNLTGCDGKIREAVALKINQLLESKPTTAEFLNYPEIFADASIDINSNICRLVIDSVGILKQDKTFSEVYLNKLLSFIEETFSALDGFIFRDKKYVINKQLFKLYWCLEGLKLFVNDIEQGKLFRILERSAGEREYTIREKAAQIVVAAQNDYFSSIGDKLKKDDNYYVRAVFN